MKIAVLVPLLFSHMATAFAPLGGGVVARRRQGVAVVLQMSNYEDAYRAAIERGNAAQAARSGYDNSGYDTAYGNTAYGVPPGQHGGPPAGRGVPPPPPPPPPPVSQTQPQTYSTPVPTTISSGTFEGKSTTVQDAVPLGSTSERLTNIERRLMEITNAIDEQTKFQRITFALNSLNNNSDVDGPNNMPPQQHMPPLPQQMSMRRMGMPQMGLDRRMDMQQQQQQPMGGGGGRGIMNDAFELKEILYSFLVNKGHYVHPDPGVRMRLVDQLESLMGVRPRLTEENGGWVVWYK